MSQKIQQNRYVVQKDYFVVFTYCQMISICGAVSQYNDGAYREKMSLTQRARTIKALIEYETRCCKQSYHKMQEIVSNETVFKNGPIKI